jgi:predicted molibdopterin-dependent oxidoreductase YjgC
MSLLRRISTAQGAPVRFWLDGQALTAMAGDTVLTAVLTQTTQLRRSEFSGMPRAGFCLIGSCQDCWMRLEDGTPLRACSTSIAEGMRLLSGTPAAPLHQKASS